MGRLVVIFFLLSCAHEARCERARAKTYFAIDAGVYVSHIEARLAAPEGLASQVSTLEGYVRFRPSFSLGKNWYVETSLGVGVPGRRGADGSVRTFILQLDTNLVAPITSWFSLRAGPGLHSLLMFSGSETVSLQNGGVGSFSTYYTPGGIRMSLSVTLQGGLMFRLSRHFQLNFDLVVQSPLSSTRRSFDGIASLGVVF